jgi:soluble lytic murein transglycosylase-like protein
MKFAAVAMLLGCSALACKYAVQSNLQFVQPVKAEIPQLRLAIEHFMFPHTPPPPAVLPAALTDDSDGEEPIPLLPKAETISLIAAAAERHNVPAAFVQSIVAAESNFNCAAISPKGAIGLMQLMPETAEQFGANPKVPAENIEAGTKYLRWLMNRYQNSQSSIKRVIAAYNAGPGMVDRYHGIPPFRETRSYVTRVLGFLKQFGGSPKNFGSKG